MNREHRRRQARDARRHARHQAHGADRAHGNITPGHYTPDADEDLATQIGWCREPSDVATVRRSTHDMLITGMGDRRTGGVSWSVTEGDTARHVLDELRRGYPPDSPEANEYRRVAACLREWGGYLVIAMAPGRDPDREAPQ